MQVRRPEASEICDGPLILLATGSQATEIISCLRFDFSQTMLLIIKRIKSDSLPLVYTVL